MKMISVSRWAASIGISTEEFDNYLKKLRYQVEDCVLTKGTTVWCLTKRGRRHGRKSRNPFSKELLWDIDALFDVMKLRGKITRKYFYCDDCGAYISGQSGFDFSMQKWVCKKCGYVNKLYYDEEDFRFGKEAFHNV